MRIVIAAALIVSIVPVVVRAQPAQSAYAATAYAPAAPAQTVNANRTSTRFNQHLGVEGEFNTSQSQPDLAALAATSRQEQQRAVYGVGMLPVGPSTDLLARVGYGTTRMRVSALGQSLMPSDEESFNFGVGAQHTSGRSGLRADFTRENYRDRKMGHGNVFSIGVSHQF